MSKAFDNYVVDDVIEHGRRMSAYDPSKQVICPKCGKLRFKQHMVKCKG